MSGLNAAPASSTADNTDLGIGRGAWAAALEVVGVCLVLGLAIGIAWANIAPHVIAGGADLDPCLGDEIQCSELFTAQVYLGAAFAVAGLAVAAIAYALRRDAGLALVIGLAIGGTAGALVAARAGVWTGHGLVFDTWSIILTWPIASMLYLVCLLVFTVDPDTNAAEVREPAAR